MSTSLQNTPSLSLHEREREYTRENAVLVNADWTSKLKELRSKELAQSTIEHLDMYKQLVKRQVSMLKSMGGEEGSRPSSQTRPGDHVVASVQKQLEEQNLDFQSKLSTKYTQFLRSLEALLQHEDEAATLCNATIQTELSTATTILHTSQSALQSSIYALSHTTRRGMADVWDERCGVLRLVEEEQLASLAHTIAQLRRETEALTKDPRYVLHTLKAKDAEIEASIAHLASRLHYALTDIDAWTQRVERDTAQWSDAQRQLKTIKSASLDRYARLQKEVTAQRQQHETTMKSVSVLSNAVENELIQLVATAETILKCISLISPSPT